MVTQLQRHVRLCHLRQPRRCLFLARDRFGIKPLYTADLPDQFVFASEIRRCCWRWRTSPTLNRQACYDYPGLNYVRAETAFREIQALPAGYALQGRRRRRQPAVALCPVTPAAEPAAVFPSAVNDRPRALPEAVRAQSVADVAVAALLSGGITSSLVVAARCRTAYEPPATFNVGFPDEAYDETPYARAVAERYHTGTRRSRSKARRSRADLVRRLLSLRSAFADSSLLPTGSSLGATGSAASSARALRGRRRRNLRRLRRLLANESIRG